MEAHTERTTFQGICPAPGGAIIALAGLIDSLQPELGAKKLFKWEDFFTLLSSRSTSSL